MVARSLGCLVVGTFWLFGSFGWSFGCLFVFSLFVYLLLLLVTSPARRLTLEHKSSPDSTLPDRFALRLSRDSKVSLLADNLTLNK